MKNCEKMTAICPYCQAEIPIKSYDAHIIAEHPERIEERALLSIQTAQKQVEYIYSSHPETRKDNGLLLFYLAKAHQNIRLYEQGLNYVIQAPYESFFYFLKRANSITRLGRHIRQPERSGEELSHPKSLKAAIKTKEAVAKVMEEVPQARYNEGVLAERVLRYFQPQGIEMNYDKSRHEIRLQAPKPLMLAVLRHIETISRRSREYREAHPFTQSPKAQEREVEYEFSTGEWAERSGSSWLPNTHVLMR